MPATIQSLHVYPVKGLKGIDLEAARCTDRGLEHDRRFMVVDPGGVFLTQRSHPKMATVWTDIAGDALELAAPGMDTIEVPLRPTGPASLRVQVWRSLCEAVHVSRAADEWLTRYLGLGCRLVYMPDASERFSNADYAGEGRRVGFADGYAYLMVGAASLEDLNRRMAAKGAPALPMNRFRPNIVVAGAAPYAEDTWGEVRVGSALLRAAKPCGRCEVTTTDQTTGDVRGPEPLATLATYRESSEFGVMFGMNYVTVTPGGIAVGDTVG